MSFQLMKEKTFEHVPVALPNLFRMDTPNGRYYRTPSGKKFPSITTVLHSEPKPELDEWRLRIGDVEADRIMEEAARNGNFLHKMCENYLKNEGYKNQDESFMKYQTLFKQVRPYLNRMTNVRAIETSLCSYKLEIAGTVDCIAQFDNRLGVQDFKNTEKEKRKEWIEHYFIQTCAYAIMWEEMTGEKINLLFIIIGNRNGVNPQLFVEKRSTWEPKLMQLVEKYHKEHP